MVACFAKYPTRVSVREQKCSFGLRTYVRHREAIVTKAVCMIWSIRNGWERLACLAGICITIPGIHYYFALTNDRRPGKTRHLYWDIWQGHNLRPLKRRSVHTGSFVYVCQAELRVEISLPQQLTSASCFLSAGPPFEPVLSERVFFFWPKTVRPVLTAFVMLLQSGAVSKSASTRTARDHTPQRADGRECPSQDGPTAPRSTSVATRATTSKRAVSFSRNSSFLSTVTLIQWEIIWVVWTRECTHVMPIFKFLLWLPVWIGF